MGKSFKDLSVTAVRELGEVFSRVDEKEVEKLLDTIAEFPRIFLLGAGREGLSTRAFTMRLMHLGKQVYWIWDDTTPAIGEGDLLLCACGSADVGHENYIVDRAKENGGKVLLITASENGYITGKADYIFKLPAAAYKASGDFVETEQLMGNLFEQALFIFFDMIVMMLREKQKVTPEVMESRHRNVE